MRLLIVIWAAAVVCLASCEQEIYELTIVPKGATVERRLTVYKSQGSPVAEEKLERLGQIYPDQTVQTVRKDDKEIKKHVFTGRFEGKMPDDVGGAGSYSLFDTRMGDAGIYLERFRGNLDIAASIEETLRSCDKLTDLLTGWLEAEFGRHAEFPKIKRFMNDDFRADLKNLCTSVVMYGNVPRLQDPEAFAAQADENEGDSDAPRRPDLNEHYFFRVLQYLTERDYFTSDDWPKLLRITKENPEGPGFAAAVEPVLTGFLERKVGVTDKRIARRIFGWATDPETLQKSVRDYLRTTEEYKKMLAEWQAGRDRSEPKDEQPPDPIEVLRAETPSLIPAPFFSGSGEVLRAEFKLKEPVMRTNGREDRETGAIKWEAALDQGDGHMLPKLCYVVWARPNGAFQKKHFGKVVLEGDDLVGYAIWRKGLDERLGREWDKFIASLRPDHESYLRLEKFRFGDEPTTQPAGGASAEPRSRAADFIEHIRSALDGSPTTRPAK